MSASPRCISVEMEEMTCGKCGIAFSAPVWFMNERRKGNPGADRNFYCPNGHPRVFRETENERLQRELAQAKKSLEFQTTQRFAAEKEVKSEQRKTARLKRRIGNGLCPCCHRTFLNVQRHMSTKHPDYKDGAGE